jgi:hypothetical protein
MLEMNKFLGKKGCEQKCQHTWELDVDRHKGRTYQLAQVSTTKHIKHNQTFQCFRTYIFFLQHNLFSSRADHLIHKYN